LKRKLTIDKFKFKILNFITFTFVVLLLVLSYIFFVSHTNVFNLYNEKVEQYIHKTIYHTLEHSKDMYKHILDRLIQEEKIAELVDKGDREALYKFLKPKFDKYKEENQYFDTLHIIEADGKSFLRVHQKDKFGDDLKSVRPMVKEIMLSQKTVTGYETGKYAQAYRILMPLYYKEHFVGSIGIGINPNYFLEKISHILDEEGMLFLKLENLELYSKKVKFRIKDFILQTEVSDDMLSILSHIPDNYNFEDSYNLTINDKIYLLHSTDVSSFLNELSGKYLFLQDVTNEVKTQNAIKFNIILVVIFFVVIIFFVIRFFIMKFGDEVDDFYEIYEYAIYGTQDGLWDWNLKTDKLYFSPRWKEMLGYKDTEIRNEIESWTNLVHPDDLEKALEDIKNNVSKKTEYYENIHRLKHKDGSWVWILDRGKTFFDNNGNPERMVGFHTNITKIKHLEEEIIQKDKLMLAQSRNAAMGEMISMIAHQWRQPLSVISMGANNIMADIELEMVNEESLKEISLEIIEQTKELSKTIDDFKEFFKPVKNSEKIFIEEILNKAFGVVGKSLENNNVNVIKEYNSKKKIETYSRELMQVFINILNNAKEVLVENNIENKEIKISLEDKTHTIIIKICDNAGGIAEDIMDKIFEPYFSTKDERTGTGLGLYMSKIIIEKHLNGTMSVSNENNGACFIIELPLVKNTNEVEGK